MSPVLTSDELAVLRLAQQGAPLARGYDAGLVFGDDSAAAYQRRVALIAALKTKGWLSRTGALTTRGAEIAKLFEARRV